MSGYTPGPWEVGQDDSELEPAVMAGDYYVATAHFGMKGDESMGQDMAVANARVIAESPTLLALLKECLANSPGRTSDWRARVEKSIARAEGRQP